MSDSQNEEVPQGNVVDNEYASRSGQTEIPVQKDEAPVEDPIDANTADSDEQLAKDDSDAIDESNIIDERTRGATQPKGTYQEPGDEEEEFQERD